MKKLNKLLMVLFAVFSLHFNANAGLLDGASSLLGSGCYSSFNLDESVGLQNQVLSDYLVGSAEFNKALVIIMDAYNLKDESSKLKAQE